MDENDSTAVAEPSVAYLYVIEYSTGVVKVGQTRDLDKRMASHATMALAHGAKILRRWTSPAAGSPRAAEAAVISFCRKRWTTQAGAEYFAGANYCEIVEYAQDAALCVGGTEPLDAGPDPQGRLNPGARHLHFALAEAAGNLPVSIGHRRFEIHLPADAPEHGPIFQVLAGRTDWQVTTRTDGVACYEIDIPQDPV